MHVPERNRGGPDQRSARHEDAAVDTQPAKTQAENAVACGHVLAPDPMRTPRESGTARQHQREQEHMTSRMPS